MQGFARHSNTDDLDFEQCDDMVHDRLISTVYTGLQFRLRLGEIFGILSSPLTDDFPLYLAARRLWHLIDELSRISIYPYTCDLDATNLDTSR